MRASLFSDHRRVILFFACLIFAVDLDREIILTVKFSRSTVLGILCYLKKVLRYSRLMCIVSGLVPTSRFHDCVHEDHVVMLSNYITN